MGGCTSKEPRHLTKVLPDAGAMMPDILRTRFVPPIKHVSHSNPWLPLLTPHQLVEIAGAFKKFDRDGDGHIEPHELRNVMRDLGCPQTEEQVKRIIAGVDVDGNGMIEFDEFVGIMAERMLKIDSNEEVEQAFALFAPLEDGASRIEVETIRQLFSQMGSTPLSKEELDKLVGLLDVDADGRVSFDAFKSLDCWQVPLPARHKKGGVATASAAGSSASSTY